MNLQEVLDKQRNEIRFLTKEKSVLQKTIAEVLAGNMNMQTTIGLMQEDMQALQAQLAALKSPPAATAPVAPATSEETPDAPVASVETSATTDENSAGLTE